MSWDVVEQYSDLTKCENPVSYFVEQVMKLENDQCLMFNKNELMLLVGLLNRR